MHTPLSGADPGFHVRVGAQLKKLRRAERGANIFGVFRVKNHDFTTKNHIFSNFRGGGGGGGAGCVKSINTYKLSALFILTTWEIMKHCTLVTRKCPC